MVVEGKLSPTVEPWIPKEKCDFQPGRGTGDQLFPLLGAAFSGGLLRHVKAIYGTSPVVMGYAVRV